MNPYRLLILDDDAADAGLVQNELEKSSLSFEVLHVQTPEQFEHQLNAFNPDLVLSDCRMPSFDGMSALKMAKQFRPDTPFIFVSGTMGEELAIETLKQGASDYVLKERLSRLCPAVEHAIADLEEKRRFEDCQEIIRVTHSHLKLILDQLPCILWTVDERMVFTSCQGKALKSLDLEGHQVIGKSVTECARAQEHDWVPVFAHRSALSGERVQYHFECRGRTFSCHVEPVFDEDQKITGAVGVGLDITEYKQLENRLFEARKMAALSHLSADIARDFKELLKLQLTYCEAARSDVHEGDPVAENLNHIARIGQKSLNLVNQLALYGHGRIFRSRSLDLNEYLASSLEMIRKLMGPGIEVDLRLNGKMSFVFIDPEYLDYALLNIATNAVEAMPEGGRYTVETEDVDLPKQNETPDGVIPNGAYVSLKFSDTGRGMSKETLERAFEPFFTTKNTDARGLGLAVVYGIFRRSGGYLQLTSDEKKGTCLQVLLPRLPESRQHMVSAAKKNRKPRAVQTILLVQKVKYLEQSLKAFLAGMGFRILVADTPEAAVRVIDENRGNVQLVFCDESIVKSKIDFTNHLASRWPSIKVLITSDIEKTKSETGLKEMTLKPYNLTVLAEKIREVLSPS